MSSGQHATMVVMDEINDVTNSGGPNSGRGAFNSASATGSTTAMSAYLRTSPQFKANRARWAEEKKKDGAVGSTPPVVDFTNRKINITRTVPWWRWGLRTVHLKSTIPYGWYVLDGEDVFCSEDTWYLLRLRPQPRQGDGLRFITAPEDQFIRTGHDLIGDLERKVHRTAQYVIEGFDDFGFVGDMTFEKNIRKLERKLRKVQERAAR